jgi:tetratricopeptide (TPR) repeat protein
VAATSEQVARVRALSVAGECERSKSLGQGVLDSATKLGYLPLKAEILFALGRLGDACADPPTAIAQLEEAALAAEASHHDEITIMASVSLSHEYVDREHDVHLSTHWVRHAEAILARFPGHPFLEAHVIGQKANVLYGQGRFEEALPLQRQTLALKEASLGPAHSEVGLEASNLALTLHELGRDAEAETTMAHAIDVYGKSVGPSSGAVAISWLDLCEILTALGRYSDAQAAVERALSIWRSHGAGAFYIGYGLLDLGRVQLASGQAQPARATLGQAVDILRKFDPQVLAEANFALARALWTSPRDRDHALELARQARAAFGQATAGARKKSAEVDAWLRQRQAG